jgi:hypothetical protein
MAFPFTYDLDLFRLHLEPTKKSKSASVGHYCLELRLLKDLPIYISELLTS